MGNRKIKEYQREWRLNEKEARRIKNGMYGNSWSNKRKRRIKTSRKRTSRNGRRTYDESLRKTEHQIKTRRQKEKRKCL
jgi:hypothetical protein